MNISLILLIVILIVFFMRFRDDKEVLTQYIGYSGHSRGRKAITKNTLERYLRVNGKCSSCRGNGKDN